MKRHYTFDEVLELDNLIKKLAIYEEASGKMFVPADYEELMDFQERCAKKFNYFKGLVQRGECTIGYLKDTILYNNGPYCQQDEMILTPEEMIDDLEESDRRLEEEREYINSICDSITSLIQDKVILATTTTTTNIEKENRAKEAEKKNEKGENKKSKSHPKRNGKEDK